jgi:hypothetical protein
MVASFSWKIFDVDEAPGTDNFLDIIKTST